jgi:hypothetical protein
MSIRTSEQINEISESFAKAQAKFTAAIKASQNPAFRSRYADLASVIEATIEHLNAEGIGVMQHPTLTWQSDVAFVMVTTRFQHKSGQWWESDVTVPAVMRDRFDAQSVGSGITYACRYALRSICTVPQEDDDANAATGTGTHDAAVAVGQAKIAAYKEKAKKAEKSAAGTPDYVPGLFYTVLPSGMYEITGDKAVMTLQKDLLSRFWSTVAKAVVVTGEQLEDLKWSLEHRNCLFSKLEPPQ